MQPRLHQEKAAIERWLTGQVKAWVGRLAVSRQCSHTRYNCLTRVKSNRFRHFWQGQSIGRRGKASAFGGMQVTMQVVHPIQSLDKGQVKQMTFWQLAMSCLWSPQCGV
ncbi:MAG: hypothetical protein FWD76_00250 [Firmicutes bacterium]|nr:hypothetical protein [Bacillota bacterium]